MINRGELKRISKEQLKGNKVTLIISHILYSVISGFIFILALPIEYSLYKMHFYLAKSDRNPEIENLVDGYKDLVTSIKLIGIILVSGIFTFFWSLLFIIPGIVKSYSYSAAIYVFLNNPDKGVMECITESRKLMNGHKWEKFVLDLSFIPNFLLVLITFGIYALFLVPYMHQVYANYYIKEVLIVEAGNKKFGDEFEPEVFEEEINKTTERTSRRENEETVDDFTFKKTTRTSNENDDFSTKKSSESNDFSDLVGSIKDGLDKDSK